MKKNAIYISVGQHLQVQNDHFRVIYVKPDITILCRMYINKLQIWNENTDKLLRMIQKGEAVIVNDQEFIVVEDDLTEKQLAKYKTKLEVIEEIESIYGPTYLDLMSRNKSPEKDELLEKYHISRPTINRWIREFLQSGMKKASLLNAWITKEKESKKVKSSLLPLGRARWDESGMPQSEELQRQFDECIQIWKDYKGKVTWKRIYEEELIGRYYREKVVTNDGVELTEKTRVPTLRQLRYYVSTKFPKDEQIKFRKGVIKSNNEDRILKGSAETGVLEAYELVEMDACEFDVALLDENRRELQGVGRPIIYMMKDVGTRMIIAVSIGFDNNSNIACISCFANLAEDKNKWCESFGITDDIGTAWPSGFKPRRLRFDNGSDFISTQVGEICKRLNIERDIVPPASGSYKGVIERSFRDAHEQLNTHFLGYGHISGEYGSKPHKEATLTLPEFVAMFLRYVITYNQTLNKGISLTDDMIRKGVKKIPQEVMQYYMQYYSPQALPTGDEFLMALLTKGKASITRSGLSFKGLRYINSADDELLAEMKQSRSKSISVLYDPRTVYVLYYTRGNKLLRAYLNLDYRRQYYFKDYTFKEYEKLRKQEKDAEIEAEKISSRLRIEMYYLNQQILNEAIEKKEGKVNTKNIRENREAAKQQWAHKQALEGRIGNNTESSMFNTLPPIDVEIKDIGETDESDYDFMDDDTLSDHEKMVLLAKRSFKE